MFASSVDVIVDYMPEKLDESLSCWLVVGKKLQDPVYDSVISIEITCLVLFIWAAPISLCHWTITF